MKAYLVTNNDGSFKIEIRTHKPKNSYEGIPIDPVTGKFEDPRWLQIENINDEFGNPVPTITVNQTLKDQLQAEDTTKKQEKEAEKQQDVILKDTLLDKLIAFDETKVKDINDIRAFMKDIKDYLLFKYKADVKNKLKKG